MNFILRSAGLQIGSSIRYEKALYGNYFLNYYIVKIIIISFNCFSEYIYRLSLRPILPLPELEEDSLKINYPSGRYIISHRNLI